MEASLHEGRFFTATDQSSKLPLAIVNEPFAARHFQGRSPRPAVQIRNTGDKGYLYTIVGVVKAIRETGALAEMKPAVYRLHEHCDQIGSMLNGIVVRTAVEPASIVSSVRQAIWSVDKNQPIARIQTMESVIVDRQSFSTPSQSSAPSSAFALLGAAARSAGHLRVLRRRSAHQRDWRAHALEAQPPARSCAPLAGRGLGLTLTGLAIGVGLAAIASRLMTTLLYGFRPDYVTTVAVVSVILVGVAVLGMRL